MIRRVPVTLAGLVVLGFFALPIVAVFARVPPGTLVSSLSNPIVTDAILVSVKTSAIAQALVVGLGTPTAWLLASRRFRGRGAVLALVELPIVLPPAVAGIGLLAAFGRVGLLHTSLPFTQSAVVLAVAFVSGPLYVRQAIVAFEGVDPTLIAASRTLGAGPARTFFRIALPLAAGGLAAGEALALARGLGEFGATIMFAGSLRGVTQTLSLAVYSAFDVDFHVALALGAILVCISLVLLLVLRWLVSASTSRFRFALSS
jgi:molybdate transport system permease protein